MTWPRQVVAGSTYLITRRCAHDAPLLGSSEEVTQVMRYALGRAAERHDVEVHAVVTTSCGYAAVVTDVGGRLPRFAHQTHLAVARAMNGRLGREENFWASGGYGAVRLVSLGDVLDGIAEVLTLPVALEGVARPEDWGGLVQAHGWGGQDSVRVRRPKGIGVGRGDRAPERVVLRLTAPTAFGEFSASEWELMVAKRVTNHVRALHQTSNQPPTSSTGHRQPARPTPRTRPRFPRPPSALRDFVRASDAATHAHATFALADFRFDYLYALHRWRLRDREVSFPHGTYWLRQFHHASVRPAPDPHRQTPA